MGRYVGQIMETPTPEEPETDSSPSAAQRELLGVSKRPGSGDLTDEEIEGWAAAIMDEIVRGADISDRSS
jgi:hypothetical protein